MPPAGGAWFCWHWAAANRLAASVPRMKGTQAAAGRAQPPPRPEPQRSVVEVETAAHSATVAPATRAEPTRAAPEKAARRLGRMTAVLLAWREPGECPWICARVSCATRRTNVTTPGNALRQPESAAIRTRRMTAPVRSTTTLVPRIRARAACARSVPRSLVLRRGYANYKVFAARRPERVRPRPQMITLLAAPVWSVWAEPAYARGPLVPTAAALRAERARPAPRPRSSPARRLRKI